MKKTNIDLKTVIGPNEQILWEGKPDKKTTILESIFNPFLVVALIWFALDMSLFLPFFNAFTEVEGEVEVTGALVDGGFGGVIIFILVFMLLHLMPVWIYLGGVLFSVKKYKRIQYLITDNGVYISGGLFSFSYDMKPWAQLSTVTMHRGIIDQKLGVGDIIFDGMPAVAATYASSFSTSRTNIPVFQMVNLRDYDKVYVMVKQLQTDVHADTMYPNALRPNENPGYKTKVKVDLNKEDK